VRKPTIRDLLDAKGERQLVLTTALDDFSARTCKQAGIDVMVTWGRPNTLGG